MTAAHHAAPAFQGIHHLKFAVADLAVSLAFYQRAIGARRIAALDHVDRAGTLFALILDVPGLGTPLELRLDPSAAAAQAGFDPLTLNVASRAELERWIAHFDRHDVPHSPILPSLFAYVLVFEDPDGRRLRFYTAETHGSEVAPANDPRWL